MADLTSSLGGGLIYEDRLPLRWRLSETVAVAGQISRLNQNNEEILFNILELEKRQTENPDEDPERNSTELARIDFKLNLLLDLVTQVYTRELEMPPETAVLLGTSELYFNTSAVPKQGDYLLVDVFLSQRFPRPVTLSGRVHVVERLHDGDFRVGLELEHLSAPLNDFLERFIFMKHRRMVASARRQHRP